MRRRLARALALALVTLVFAYAPGPGPAAPARAQGARLKNIPYPSGPEAVSPLLAGAEHRGGDALRDYGDQR